MTSVLLMAKLNNSSANEPVNDRAIKVIRLATLAAAFLIVSCCADVTTLSFPSGDGGIVWADEYGSGSHAVILAHGGRFTKESWTDQAIALADSGFRVIAFDFRGRGNSRGPATDSTGRDVHMDVVGAIDYARESGASTVSIVGASFGGWAAAQATSHFDDPIDHLVLLGAGADEPESVRSRNTLVLLARDDYRGENTLRLPEITEDYERLPGPKEMILFEGDAHAQFLFDTDQADSVLSAITRFLRSEPNYPTER